MHKREKKKTGPFVRKTHVPYKHNCNAVLREWMDIKTVPCFVTDMKKGKENGTLCFQSCRRILRTMGIAVSYMILHDGIYC